MDVELFLSICASTLCATWAVILVVRNYLAKKAFELAEAKLRQNLADVHHIARYVLVASTKPAPTFQLVEHSPDKRPLVDAPAGYRALVRAEPKSDR